MSLPALFLILSWVCPHCSWYCHEFTRIVPDIVMSLPALFLILSWVCPHFL
jgi:hypothetical protein